MKRMRLGFVVSFFVCAFCKEDIAYGNEQSELYYPRNSCVVEKREEGGERSEE